MYDEPQMYEEWQIKHAQKIWQCCECGEDIPMRDPHMRGNGVWSGHWHSFRWCMTCDALRKKLLKELPPNEWPAYGDVRGTAIDRGILVIDEDEPE
jgi:hypothetical protein